MEGRHRVRPIFSFTKNFSDLITAQPKFDDRSLLPIRSGTPATFAFTGSRPDLEQAAFLQDLIHLGNWTVNAGTALGSLSAHRESKTPSAPLFGRALSPAGT